MIQNTPVADEASQLGEAYHLGTLVETFRIHYSRANAIFFIYQIANLLLMIVLLSIVVVAYFVYHIHNVTWIYFGIVALNSVNIVNISRRRNKSAPVVSPFESNRRIYVYQHGLISIRNKRPVMVRWEQVRQVRYIRPNPLRGRIASVSVVYEDNKRVKQVGVSMGNGFSNEDLDALGTLLEQRTKQHL